MTADEPSAILPQSLISQAREFKESNQSHMPRGGPRKGAGRKRTKPQQTAGKTKRVYRPRTPKPATLPPVVAEIKESNTHEVIAGAEKLTTRERQLAFLEAFAANGNVLRSCQRIGIPRSLIYQDWNKQPEFKAAFDAAAEDSNDLLEEEARRRGVDGVLKPIYQGGKLVGHVREYSDTVLLALLRAKREAFREKRSIGVGVEGSVTGGVRKVIVEIDEAPGVSA